MKKKGEIMRFPRALNPLLITVKAGEEATARADQATANMRSLTDAFHTEAEVRAAEERKARAAAEAAEILSAAGF